MNRLDLFPPRPGQNFYLPKIRRVDRLRCQCGKTAKVLDQGTEFVVKCCCKRETRASTEKQAITLWEELHDRNQKYKL